GRAPGGGLGFLAEAGVRRVADERRRAPAARQPRRDHVRGAVRRRVVGDDDLEVAAALRAQRFQRLLHVARVVVGRDQDADRRCGHFCATARAGLPMTVVRAGTSRSTTAPAATLALAPTRTLRASTAPAPTVAPLSSTTWPATTQPGPSETKPSMATSCPTDALRLMCTKGPMRARAPTAASALMTTPSSSAAVRATTAVA